MNSEVFSKVINRQIIVDQVASFLYATGAVPHSKEITDIQFTDFIKMGKSDLCEIKIFTKEEAKN